VRRDDLDDAQDDALGLASTYPRPGWVVLDAIRDRGFTGEVMCRTTPGVMVWADRGVIYLAERDDDPSLGRRLVEAGALTEAQLAAGAVQVSGDEHLGLLFERAPDIDRHAVIVTNQLLTDDCVGWLAGQRVHGAIVIPYRHHASGAHRWRDDHPAPPPFGPGPGPDADTPAGGPSPFAPPTPGAVPSTLPPPPPFAPPAPAPGGPSVAPPPLPPAPSVTSLIAPLPMPGRRIERLDDRFDADTDVDVDDVIRWDEPGWLGRPLPDDRSSAALSAATPTTTTTTAATAASSVGIDVSWSDRIVDPAPVAAGQERQGHQERQTRAAVLPAPAGDPFDRFEVIWPSGEVDEQFGGQPLEACPDPDIDRAGPTARLVRDGGSRGGTVEAVRIGDVADSVVEHALGDGVAELESFLADQAVRSVTTDVVDDDVLAAVRHAVAEIETGALVQRERRIGPRSGLVIDGGALAPTDLRLPGRVALRDTGENPTTSTGRMTRPVAGAGSVFDVVPPVQPPVSHDVADTAATGEPIDTRASALRRLIGSLKRR
jgi:hypothetical protein